MYNTAWVTILSNITIILFCEFIGYDDREVVKLTTLPDGIADSIRE